MSHRVIDGLQLEERRLGTPKSHPATETVHGNGQNKIDPAHCSRYFELISCLGTESFRTLTHSNPSLSAHEVLMVWGRKTRSCSARIHHLSPCLTRNAAQKATAIVQQRSSPFAIWMQGRPFVETIKDVAHAVSESTRLALIDN